MDTRNGRSKYTHPAATEPEGRFQLRQIMNLVFVLAALILMVLYFVVPDALDRTWYTICALVTILIKISEIVIRYLPK